VTRAGPDGGAGVGRETDSPAALLLDRTFEYLLNRMEFAAQSETPAALDYGAKRRAVFAYVAELQRLAALAAPAPGGEVNRG
jgi:hypothetical protein